MRTGGVIRTTTLAWLAALTGFLQVSVSSGEPRLFSNCEKQLRAKPGARAAARCFLEVANRKGHRAEAWRLLKEHADADRRQPWPLFYAGRLSFGEDAYRDLRDARGAFVERGDHASAFSAQMYLVQKLALGTALEETAEEIERARTMLPDGDPAAADRLRLAEAILAARRGALDDALGVLTAIRERTSQRAPDPFQHEFLYRLGALFYDLGRYAEALELFEQVERLSEQLEDHYNDTYRIYMVASSHAALADANDRPRVIKLFRRAYRSAKTYGNTIVVANASLELAKLLPDADERRRYLEQCLEVRDTLDALTLSGCLGVGAFELRNERPEEARRLMDEAIAVARDADEPWPLVYLGAERLPVSWSTLPRAEAIRESEATLQDVERLRDTLRDPQISAQYFAVWVEPYAWLAGRLLESADESTLAEHRKLAFEIVERYRARVLLEHLRSTGTWPALPDTRRDAVSTVPSGILDEVENALADDEVLLVFQVGSWSDLYGRFGGGLWLFSVTHGGTRVYRLGDRSDLEKKVTGLLESKPRRRAAIAAELYRELRLDQALADAGPAADKLLIVPDGILHELSFGTLGPRGQAPLTERYETSLLPSASIWLGWRRDADAPVPRPSLVLADPVRPDVEASADGRRGVVPTDGGLRCRRLRYAREEGREVLRLTGGDSVLRIGEEASESFLKQVDLGRFGMIHMASHAFVDASHATGSLVCLAAGDGGEDGDLEFREIAQLDLDGQLVVLASCESAAGPRLAGEGVMSLARAFFLAGARTVVASLREIDDADARSLFVLFHRYLAEGRSVGAALQSAKRELLRSRGAEGAANSAWRNVVVTGDASLRPIVAESAAPARYSWLVWALAVLVIYLISIGIRVWLQRR